MLYFDDDLLYRRNIHAQGAQVVFRLWILSLEPLEALPPEWVVASLSIPEFEEAHVVM